MPWRKIFAFGTYGYVTILYLPPRLCVVELISRPLFCSAIVIGPVTHTFYLLLERTVPPGKKEAGREIDGFLVLPSCCRCFCHLCFLLFMVVEMGLRAIWAASPVYTSIHSLKHVRHGCELFCSPALPVAVLLIGPVALHPGSPLGLGQKTLHRADLFRTSVSLFLFFFFGGAFVFGLLPPPPPQTPPPSSLSPRYVHMLCPVTTLTGQLNDPLAQAGRYASPIS